MVSTVAGKSTKSRVARCNRELTCRLPSDQLPGPQVRNNVAEPHKQPGRLSEAASSKMCKIECLERELCG